MTDRLSDEQFDELLQTVLVSYEGGAEILSPWAREWLGPDGGVLSLLNELKAERARLEQLEDAISTVYVNLTDGKLSKPWYDPRVIIAEVEDACGRQIAAETDCVREQLAQERAAARRVAQLLAGRMAELPQPINWSFEEDAEVWRLIRDLTGEQS